MDGKIGSVSLDLLLKVTLMNLVRITNLFLIAASSELRGCSSSESSPSAIDVCPPTDLIWILGCKFLQHHVLLGVG